MTITLENGNPTPLSSGDRWTPVLKGEVFCSPACGCDCKKADFDSATEKARLLANTLGDGWEPCVWENCGWHFEAKKRGATVSVDRHQEYTADVRFKMSDDHELLISETRNCPREAVCAVVDEINTRIASLKRALVSLSLSPLEIAG